MKPLKPFAQGLGLGVLMAAGLGLFCLSLAGAAAERRIAARIAAAACDEVVALAVHEKGPVLAACSNGTMWISPRPGTWTAAGRLPRGASDAAH